MTIDVAKLAKKAHRILVTEYYYPGHIGQINPWEMQLLTLFAALVRDEVIEECALKCDGMHDATVMSKYATQAECLNIRNVYSNLAAVIRHLKGTT